MPAGFQSGNGQARVSGDQILVMTGDRFMVSLSNHEARCPCDAFMVRPR